MAVWSCEWFREGFPDPKKWESRGVNRQKFFWNKNTYKSITFYAFFNRWCTKWDWRRPPWITKYPEPLGIWLFRHCQIFNKIMLLRLQLFALSVCTIIVKLSLWWMCQINITDIAKLVSINWYYSRKSTDYGQTQVTVAISVEAPAFIVIGRSCLEGCGFNSHCRPGSFLRLNSRSVMYNAVGSLASSWILGLSNCSIPARSAGLNHVMTLSKLCSYTCALANQAIHPFMFGKFVPAICRE